MAIRYRLKLNNSGCDGQAVGDSLPHNLLGECPTYIEKINTKSDSLGRGVVVTMLKAYMLANGIYLNMVQ